LPQAELIWSLGTQGDVDRGQPVEAGQGHEQGADGDHQRGRRGQTGALRHVAGDHHVHALHREALLLREAEQVLHHAAHVVGPHRLLQALDRGVEAELIDRIVVVGGDHLDHAVVAQARRDHRAVVDGAGQHQAAGVVGVFADQVDAARGLHDQRRRFAEGALENAGHAGRQGCAHSI
jgi:hypothetical protein